MFDYSKIKTLTVVTNHDGKKGNKQELKKNEEDIRNKLPKRQLLKLLNVTFA